jgi:hypothetical protein
MHRCHDVTSRTAYLYPSSAWGLSIRTGSLDPARCAREHAHSLTAQPACKDRQATHYRAYVPGLSTVA